LLDRAVEAGSHESSDDVLWSFPIRIGMEVTVTSSLRFMRVLLRNDCDILVYEDHLEDISRCDMLVVARGIRLSR